MAELDFLIVSDYVRSDQGLLHVIGGGIQRIALPAVPTVITLGVGLRLLLEPDEANRRHQMQLNLRRTDGEKVAGVNVDFSGSPTPETSTNVPFGVTLALNAPFAIPAYGTYQLDLLVGGAKLKSVAMEVTAPAGDRQ